MEYKLAYNFLLEAEVIFDEHDLIKFCNIHNNFITFNEASNILNYLFIKGLINKNSNFFSKTPKLLKDPHNKQTLLFNALLNNPLYNQKIELKKAFKALCLSENAKMSHTLLNKEIEKMFQTLYALSNNTHRFEF